MIKSISVPVLASMTLMPVAAQAESGHLGGADASHHAVDDAVIAAQRAALHATLDAGFGPQSPRDLDSPPGRNLRVFSAAPDHARLNLCNIHFHESAEHRGGEFTS